MELASRWGARAGLSISDQALVSGANFALNIALARWLSVDEYGGFAVIYSLFLFISGFHNALVLEPMNVLGASRTRDSLPGYFGSLIWIQVGILLLFSCLLAAAISFADLHDALAEPMLGLALTLPALLLYWFLRQACYLKTRPACAFCGGLAFTACVVTGLALLHATERATAFNGFIVLGLSSVTASAVLWRLLSSIGNAPSLRATGQIRAVLLDHWSYGRWVLGSALVYGLGNFFYVPLVSALGSLAQAGAVRALQNLIAPVQQLLTAFNLLWLPWAARHAMTAEKPALQRALLTILGFMTAVTVVYAVLLVSFSEFLTSILYGPGTYDQYHWIIPYFGFAVVIGAVNNGLILSLKSLSRPDQVLFSQVISAVLTLTVGTLLVWQFGILGVAFGSILSGIAAALFLWNKLRSAFVSSTTSLNLTRHPEKRIAWLVPSMDRGFYWHPVFQEFVRLFPETVIFTGSWPGFASGSENAFKVRVVGKTRYFNFRSFVSGKTRTFIIPSLAIVPSIMRFRPQVIFTSAFSLWSTLVVLLKPWKKWRIVVFYDGSAPSVDSTDSRVKLFMRRLITKNVDALVTNSHGGKKYLVGALHADVRRVFRHPYQVPSAAALLAHPNGNAPKPFSLNVKHPVFLFIGQLIPRKGIEFLLEACILLNQDRRAHYTVLIAGDGPKRAELEEKICIRGLTKEVQLVGWVNYAQIGNYMKLADVFVLPTLEDIWGMVILEAMVFGKPILCSKWAGTSEMVIDGENGFVFDPYQPEQLAGLMRRFIDSPSLIRSMGERSMTLIAPHNPQAAAEGLAGVALHVLRNQQTCEPLGAGVCLE
jgi:glycosyltransferase involved in cell wall biosynthesis